MKTTKLSDLKFENTLTEVSKSKLRGGDGGSRSPIQSNTSGGTTYSIRDSIEKDPNNQTQP